MRAVLTSPCLSCCPLSRTTEVVPGPLELHSHHPARTFPLSLLNFRLPAEKLLKHLQSLPDWQQVPVLSDADITAKATCLGLLPAKTLQARGETWLGNCLLHACTLTVCIMCCVNLYTTHDAGDTSGPKKKRLVRWLTPAMCRHGWRLLEVWQSKG